MMGLTDLVVLGFGGHARSVADVAMSLGVRQLLFVDENARENENFLGFPVVRELLDMPSKEWSCFPGAGDNARRHEQLIEARSKGWRIATLISPRASIGVGAIVEEGCFIGHQAHVGPTATIGSGSIINSGAVVDHESIIGTSTHVSVNATVAGRVSVGKFVFIGAGAAVIDGIVLGDHITIGAGGVVVEAIHDPGTYVGVPVRRLAG